MGEYRVNTDELRKAAQQLLTKAGDMRTAVSSVDSAMAPARSMQAPVVAKNIEQWDALKSSLQRLFAEAESASKLINTTATNIDIVLKGG